MHCSCSCSCSVPKTMWYNIWLVCFAILQVGNAFGSLPYGNSTARPFTLRVTDGQIRDFKSLLTASKVGPEAWYTTQRDGQLGITREWLTGAKKAWVNFDWLKQERRINSFPNFKAMVGNEALGATPIHFTALFSKRKDALPLLFLHGWPGSIFEFLPMLDILKNKYTPETFPYHVIVPSLPHFGLSGGADRRGTHFIERGGNDEPAHAGSWLQQRLCRPGWRCRRCPSPPPVGPVSRGQGVPWYLTFPEPPSKILYGWLTIRRQ